MKNLKTALTKMGSKVQSNFPDGNDIWGYSGINKQLIADTISQIYVLATEIDGQDDGHRFEIIYLKRQASEINRSINNILDSDKPEEKFDDFLSKLEKLLWAAKHTFFVVNKNGLRSDEELANLKMKISSLRAADEELVSIRDDYDSAFDIFQEKIVVVSEYSKTIEEKQKKISEQTDIAKEKYENINIIHENIEGWDEEIAEKKDIFSTLEKKILSLQTTASNLKKTLDEQIALAAKNQETIDKQQAENKEFLNDIQETLAGANKKSMAASFQERKTELRGSLITWGVLFCVAITGLLCIAIGWLIPEIKTDIEWFKILGRVTIAAPLVWLAWFSAKQYLSISRIREDYAFKYAAAMAYEGHKKAARELKDEELEKALLMMSLCNMEQNPIRLYGKESHASPVNEIIAKINCFKWKLSPASSEIEAQLKENDREE